MAASPGPCLLVLFGPLQSSVPLVWESPECSFNLALKYPSNLDPCLNHMLYLFLTKSTTRSSWYRLPQSDLPLTSIRASSIFLVKMSREAPGLGACSNKIPVWIQIEFSYQCLPTLTQSLSSLFKYFLYSTFYSLISFSKFPFKFILHMNGRVFFSPAPQPV